MHERYVWVNPGALCQTRCVPAVHACTTDCRDHEFACSISWRDRYDIAIGTSLTLLGAMMLVYCFVGRGNR